MYLNKVQLIGNLTRDPEVRALPSGSKVCNFSVATNRTWKDKESGKKQEEVEFHNVVAFGKTAELIQQYVHKGDQIMIEGRLKTSSWDDKKSGVKKYRTEVICETMQFGAKRKGSEGAAPAEKQYDTANEFPENINPDDIPF
jgi:single-strand DNA-binding protein